MGSTGAGVVAYQVKPTVLTPDPIWVPVQSRQLSATGLGKTGADEPGPGPLPPPWEAQKKLLASNFGLAHSWPSRLSGKKIREWKTNPSVSF